MTESVFGGTGRPHSDDSEQRFLDFRDRLLAGESFADAQRHARISGSKVVRLLDEQHFQALAIAILEGRLGPTAVVLEDALDVAA
jgi:hypothetical protein